jgi:hypothetical protein
MKMNVTCINYIFFFSLIFSLDVSLTSKFLSMHFSII